MFARVLLNLTPSLLTAALFLIAGLLIGCGAEPAGTDPAGGLGDAEPATPSSLPVASIGGAGPVRTAGVGPTPDGGDDALAAASAGDDPVALLNAIKALRIAPFPDAHTAADLERAQQRRHGRIAAAARKVVAMTHADPAGEKMFTDAVFLMLSARLQLALAGDADSIDSLYEDGEALYKRDPASKAAAEARFAVARFAHTNAGRFPEDERWLGEFTRQARLFADQFPAEHARAAKLLASAGWSCELAGRPDEAAACLSLIAEKFPDTPESAAATAALRRLRLTGRVPQLGGRTLSGGVTAVDREPSRGHPVVVFFWSADAPACVRAATAVVDAAAADPDLRVLSVCLDESAAAAKSFAAAADLPGEVLFPDDAETRGWEHPVARYYGVRDIPALWLLDAGGRVVSTTLSAETLGDAVRGL